MQLLKSLICFKGFDNGRRFLIISLSCYLLIFIFSSSLAKLIFLIFLLPVILLAAVRRVRDAGFHPPLVIVPVISFICVFWGASLEQGWPRWLLLILSLLATLGFAVLSNARVRRRHDYVLGYSGPVDLMSTQPEPMNIAERVEPTMEGSSNYTTHSTSSHLQSNSEELLAPLREPQPAHQKSPSSAMEHTIEDIKDWIGKNQKLAIVALAAIALLILIILFFSASSETNESQSNQTETVKVVEPPKQRHHKIEMPDSFWLMLDENDALSIAWQGDEISDQILWPPADLGQANRDQTSQDDCSQILFNNQQSFQVTRVEAKNQGDYYADFVVADTQAIVKAIAKKSTFKLCGYNFSLKGTQAKLRTHKKYKQFFDND
jgi:hypothetical protein